MPSSPTSLACAAVEEGGRAGPVVEFAPAGYRLTRNGSRFDHLAFATLADEARAALERDDHAAASASAREALDLWRGPALAGLAGEPALLADVAALDGEG